MEKKCTTCKIVKNLDKFGNKKSSKDKKSHKCKDCCRDYSKKWREDNKQIIQKNKKKEYQKNKEKYLLRSKEDYKNNKEKHKLYKKKYFQINKIKINNRILSRRKLNPMLKLKKNIASNILIALKKQGYTKKNKTYNILGCQYDFFMEWLNYKASNGYTYGIGNLNLDHVVPISLAETEDELYLLNHYSNFQLLTQNENYSKGNRHVNPLNLARVLEHHPNPDKIREIHARL